MAKKRNLKINIKKKICEISPYDFDGINYENFIKKIEELQTQVLDAGYDCFILDWVTEYYDGGSSCYHVFGLRSETDEEYITRIKNAKQDKKDKKDLQNKKEFEEYERLKKKFEGEK